jgi:hypothetical protein
VLHVIHRLPDALMSDKQRGLTTLRQQIVAWLTAFTDLSEECGRMLALSASARRVIERLRDLWPVEVCHLPYYPAFRNED